MVLAVLDAGFLPAVVWVETCTPKRSSALYGGYMVMLGVCDWLGIMSTMESM